MIGCTYEPVAFDGERIAAVSAEIGALPHQELAVVEFLSEVAWYRGGVASRVEAVCSIIAGHSGPGFVPALLRAGTCAAGWCTSREAGEAQRPARELYLGLRRGVGGAWRLAPLSDKAMQRLRARGPLHWVGEADACRPVVVDLRSCGEVSGWAFCAPERSDWTAADVLDLVGWSACPADRVGGEP